MTETHQPDPTPVVPVAPVVPEVPAGEAPAVPAAAETPEVSTHRALNPVEGEWRGISPKYILLDVVANAIGTAIAVAGGIFAVLILDWPPIGWAVPVGILVISGVTIAFTPRRMRAIGYMLRADDMLFRTGILFRRMVAVPYGRMQLVDINRGPLVRAFGLAELKLITAAAATAVTIPGLPFDEAEELRDHLVAVAETRRAGL